MENIKIEDFIKKSEAVLLHLKSKLDTIRTGRANPLIFNNIKIDYYDVMTPINQLASITVPEPQQVLITPYDISTSKLIVNAINNSDIGLQAQNQGHVIRINIPSLTEERRKELVKQVNIFAEQAKVEIRNNRRNTNDMIKKDLLTKDDVFQLQNQIQKLTDDYIKNIELITKNKEKDLMKI